MIQNDKNFHSFLHSKLLGYGGYGGEGAGYGGEGAGAAAAPGTTGGHGHDG